MESDKPEIEKKEKTFKIKCNTVCFTAYGKAIEEDPEGFLRMLAATCDWVLGQQECCPDTKRLHVQGMAHHKGQSRWTFLIKQNAHLEKCMDPTKSIQYCSKEESRVLGPWEFGERPSFNVKGAKLAIQAEKNKNLIEKEITELVNEGHISFTSVPNIIKAKQYWTMINPGEPKEKLENLWIHGDPGSGKTRYAKETFKDSLYEKSMNRWWDAFKGEDNVLLDDFDLQGKCLGHYLKIWGDRYFGFKSETKGGTIQPNFKRFIITSNYTPAEIWGGFGGDEQLVKAIERRFRVIKMVDGQLQEDIGN